MQKSLFKTAEQLQDFQMIIIKLILDRDLEKALDCVSSVISKRKKISLDPNAIASINQKHTGTVELLNRYLQDDYEDEFNTIKIGEISTEELSIAITSKSDEQVPSIFLEDLRLTPLQVDTILFFAKSNFAIAQVELEMMAKSKGAFRNQLIDSINEVCYETIDDVLIEEEEENYIINEHYYQRILLK